MRFRRSRRPSDDVARLREEIRYLDARHTATLIRQNDERLEHLLQLLAMKQALDAAKKGSA